MRFLSRGEDSLAEGREPTMSEGVLEARRLALIRFERAAGAAFGCEDEAAAPPARLLTAPAAIVLATLAAAVAATIAFLA